MGERFRLLLCRFTLELRYLLARRRQFLRKLFYARLKLLRLSLQFRAEVVYGGGTMAQIGFRAAPRQRLDAANTGGDARLLRSDIRADLSRGGAMGAAA